MLPTASGRWILVYKGCKHSLGANIPFAAKSFLWRQFCRGARLVGVFRRRSAFRLAGTRSTQGCVEQATCWLGRSVALPVPNLSDASFGELEWLHPLLQRFAAMSAPDTICGGAPFRALRLPLNAQFDVLSGLKDQLILLLARIGRSTAQAVPYRGSVVANRKSRLRPVAYHRWSNRANAGQCPVCAARDAQSRDDIGAAVPSGFLLSVSRRGKRRRFQSATDEPPCSRVSLRRQPMRWSPSCGGRIPRLSGH